MWPFQKEIVEEEGLLAKYLSAPYNPGYVVLFLACVGFVVCVHDTIQSLKGRDRSAKAGMGRVFTVSPEVVHNTRLVFTFLSVEHNALLFAGVVTHNAAFLIPWMISSGGVLLFGSLLALTRFWKEGFYASSWELLTTFVFLVKVWHVFSHYVLLTRDVHEAACYT